MSINCLMDGVFNKTTLHINSGVKNALTWKTQVGCKHVVISVKRLHAGFQSKVSAAFYSSLFYSAPIAATAFGAHLREEVQKYPSTVRFEPGFLHEEQALSALCQNDGYNLFLHRKRPKSQGLVTLSSRRRVFYSVHRARMAFGTHGMLYVSDLSRQGLLQP